jgi:hypothetical protein
MVVLPKKIHPLPIATIIWTVLDAGTSSLCRGGCDMISDGMKLKINDAISTLDAARISLKTHSILQMMGVSGDPETNAYVADMEQKVIEHMVDKGYKRDGRTWLK